MAVTGDFIQLFGILLIIITAISFAVKLLKQPIIIGYVLAGLTFSLFFIAEGVTEQVHAFSELGITFLLFLMGLEFDLKSLKFLGKDLVTATLRQSMLFFLISFGIALLLGFNMNSAVYLGMLFMFSSTLLVAKWIDDKKENSTLHGKLSFGMLIVEDIIAIVGLTLLSVLKESSFSKILLIPLQGIALVVIAFLFAKYLLNRPLKIASKYPELLFIFGLSVCFLFASIIAPKFGYSATIGAFIGGIVLANTLYKVELAARLKPLVTFFNMLFFVGLGFFITFDLGLKEIIFIVIMLILNLLVKPLIIYVNLRLKGYDLKTAFLSGTYMSQLSEFGIIITAGGVASGVIGSDVNSIAIISVIMTMILSSYLIKYDQKVFKFFEKRIVAFDKRFVTKETKFEVVHLKCNILFFGYFDINRDLLEKFKSQGKKIIVVDNDPESIAILEKEGVEVIYNSINNPDFFELHNFSGVEIVISGITDASENKTIILEVKKENPKALVVVTAKTLNDSIELYNHSADYVIYTKMLNEQRVSLLLEDFTSNINQILDKRMGEIKKLKDRDAKIKASRNSEEFYDVESFMREIQQTFTKKKPKVKEEQKIEETEHKKSFEFVNVAEKYLK